MPAPSQRSTTAVATRPTPSRHGSPIFSGIRETSSQHAEIHTVLTWEKLRSEFGPGQQAAAVGGAVGHADHAIGIVVGIGYGLRAGPLRLLCKVALIVEVVSPPSVMGGPVARAVDVSGHRAVAVAVIRIIRRDGAGELVVGVVAVIRGRTVVRLGDNSMGQVIRVRVIGQNAAAAVL